MRNETDMFTGSVSFADGRVSPRFGNGGPTYRRKMKGCWWVLGQKRFLWRSEIGVEDFINLGNYENRGFPSLVRSFFDLLVQIR